MERAKICCHVIAIRIAIAIYYPVISFDLRCESATIINVWLVLNDIFGSCYVLLYYLPILIILAQILVVCTDIRGKEANLTAFILTGMICS